MRKQRHILGGVQGPLPIGTLLFMASAAHEDFKGVNQLLVTLEDMLRIQQYWGFVVVGKA